YLVEADYGFLASSARIHVRSITDLKLRLAELKLRLAELGWLTKLGPEERRRIESDNAQWAFLLSDIRAAERQRHYELVINLCDPGLQARHGNTELLVIRREALRNLHFEQFQKAHGPEQELARQLLQKTSTEQDSLVAQAHAAAREQALQPADRQRRDA